MPMRTTLVARRRLSSRSTSIPGGLPNSGPTGPQADTPGFFAQAAGAINPRNPRPRRRYGACDGRRAGKPKPARDIVIGFDGFRDRALHALARDSRIAAGSGERAEHRSADPYGRGRDQIRPGRGTADRRFDLQLGRVTAQFFRLFETSFGVSPRVYLNAARLERAVQAVSDSEAKSLRDFGESWLLRSCAFLPLLPRPCGFVALGFSRRDANARLILRLLGKP